MLGYDTSANFVLADETAANQDNVNKMLRQLAPAAVNNAKREAADLQKVIDENGGIEMSGQAGRRAFDDVVEPFRKQAIENGDKVTSLSQDELKRWQAASEKVYDAWFAEIAKKGGDGKRLLQDARELLEKNRR